MYTVHLSPKLHTHLSLHLVGPKLVVFFQIYCIPLHSNQLALDKKILGSVDESMLILDKSAKQALTAALQLCQNMSIASVGNSEMLFLN